MKKKLSDLEIGEWMPTEDGDFTIRLEDDTDGEVYYSSKNQDTIMILEHLIKK